MTTFRPRSASGLIASLLVLPLTTSTVQATSAADPQYERILWDVMIGRTVGVAPNQGDTSVPCFPGTCAHQLDVRGG